MENLFSLKGSLGRPWVVFLVIALLTLLPAMPVSGEVVGSGDYEAGRKLFTGERSFSNGGAPCISCHNAGVGSLGGGTLGPDLTKVWTNKSFLINGAWINAVGIPVMGPVFSTRNITPEEVEHLKTFFSAQAEKGAVVQGGGGFVGGGVAGFVALVILFSIIWSGRYRSRNKGTAHDELWRNYSGKGGAR